MKKVIGKIIATVLAISMVATLAITAIAQSTAQSNTPPSNTSSSESADAGTETASSTSHQHHWEVLGYCENGITVVCEGCHRQINIPLDALDCEHELQITTSDDVHHTYECSKCTYLAEAEHTFDYVMSNEYHYLACTECGFIKNVENHTLEIFFDSEEHFKSCATCGYSVKEAHNYSYWYDNNIHIKECDSCSYTAEYCPHKGDFCPCGYITEGKVYGIITDTHKERAPYDEYLYFATVLVDGEYNLYEITRDVRNNAEEGDFFEMTFKNNVIVEAKELVSCSNYLRYDPLIGSHMGYDGDLFCDSDITVNDIDIYDDVISIYFENNRFLDIYHDVIVYDLANAEVVDIEDIEGCMVMYYTPEGHNITTILIVE